MADKYWTGATSASFGVAGNWSPSGIPVAGDVLYFADAPSNAIAGSDQKAIALGGVRVGPGYNNTIGSSGTPLILDTPYLRYAGTGTSAWFELQDVSGSLVTVIVSGTPATSDNTTAGLHLDTVTSTQSLELRVSSGVVTVEDGADVTTVIVGSTLPSGSSNVAAEVYLGSSLLTTTLLTVLGGTCYSETGFTTVDVGGGTVIPQDDDWTTINVWGPNGVVNWQNAGEGKTITTLNIYLGQFTSKNNKANFTVTNSTIWDGTIATQCGIGVPTFSNATTIKGRGQLVTDAGTTATSGLEI